MSNEQRDLGVLFSTGELEDIGDGCLGCSIPIDSLPPELRERLFLMAKNGEVNLAYEIVSDGNGGNALHFPEIGLTLLRRPGSR